MAVSAPKCDSDQASAVLHWGVRPCGQLPANREDGKDRRVATRLDGINGWRFWFAAQCCAVCCRSSVNTGLLSMPIT